MRALIGLVIVIGLFAFLHGGHRGVEMCNYQGGAAGPGTLSLWPPGTKCTGGELAPFVLVDHTYLALSRLPA